MNVVMLDPVVPESLRRRLAALPQFEPPATLRARVGVAWAAPRRARVGAAWLAAAAALALALAIGWTQRVPAPAADRTARMAGLEREVGALRAARAPVATAAALEAELQQIDRALQAAYDDAAPAPRIEALWSDREALLDGLLLAYRQPDRMIRI